jgi:hypothetical protein
MVDVNDGGNEDISDGPFTVESPDLVRPDSVLRGDITGTVVLRRTKIYGLDGYVFISGGGKLVVEPGTIVVGDTVGQNSAICVNRGGVIIAQGTKADPIIFTSSAAVGQRARGDWGGILICGKARTNHPGGSAALEGGIADPTDGPNARGWFGGNDDNDSSGVLEYCRIEFAGIAVAPNSELNSLTMGAVGRRTRINYVQVSYGNDDGFEWFGGTVNHKYLISYGVLDDDFDSDNGYTGKVQFGLIRRFRTVADVSTSQAFESDNNAQSSYNAPFTAPVYTNITAIGPVADTSWTAGNGLNQYNSRFGASAQIRRNSRTSIYNSIFVGWPRGLEIAQSQTMIAANGDSLHIRNCGWYGIKGTWMNLAGGTPPSGMDANWIAKAPYNNAIDKSSPSVAALTNPFATDNTFSAVPQPTAPYLNTAAFPNNSPVANLQDPFFTQVDYRGAFSSNLDDRWDAGWTEYDPVNAEYRAGVNVRITSPGGAANEKLVKGSKVDITWDTTGTKGLRWKFEYGTSPVGPWNAIAGADNVLDDGASRGKLAQGFTVPSTSTTSGYIKMSYVTDPDQFDISDNAFSIIDPPTPTVKILEPGTNVRSIRVGQTATVTWDTTNTYNQRFRFEYGKSSTGPWATLSGLASVKDSAAPNRARGSANFVLRPQDQTTTGYIRMTLLADTTKIDVSDNAFVVEAPAPVACDSVLRGDITGNIHLSNTKVYCLDGYVFVSNGATVTIDPGTIILGDTVGQNSVLCVNRGGKLIAEGTRQLPIVFTSSAVPGQRARGDWGGIVMCGKARTNHPGGSAAIEGGIADLADGPTARGWFGGTDDADNSGTLKYVRIEFAGIAVAPNSELNSLTMGGVGSGTMIDYVQVSHGNDDAYEWFGGTVDAKHLVAIGTLDDDFDTDNGYRGRVQYGIVQRFRTVADVSTSQAFESDNNAQSSYNEPFTNPTFSNITAIGPVQDTTWTAGNGNNQFNSRFGAAAQIRRNSRHAIHNSLFVGWPRGLEIAQTQTMEALKNDSIQYRHNSMYGIKGSATNFAGGTPPSGLTTDWINDPALGNTIDRSTPANARLEDPFAVGVQFNPALQSTSPALGGASFAAAQNTKISDTFFDRVDYRGAMGLERWDAGWTEYEPVNAIYRAQDPTSVEEDAIAGIISGEVFPNPTSDAARVRYTLGGENTVTVFVTDATGALNATFIANTTQQSGVYEFTLDTRDLASGVYFVRILGQTGTLTLPVTVTR